jgi:PAT family beta-lactamase induction signal transducer AmpG
MAVPDTAGGGGAARASFAETLAVYVKPRVLVVMFLGFSSGLPLALSGGTLLVWMREVGIDLGTIGLFALVGTPYTLKFLWAPLITRSTCRCCRGDWAQRRLALLSQFLLIAAIVFLGASDPAASPLIVAVGALMVATSATRDIVVVLSRGSLSEANKQPG